jgi:proteic killer suppression protein
VEIQFTNKKLKNLCEQQSLAQRKWGKDVAQKLKIRLNDLRMVSCMKELSRGCPHPLTGDLAGKYALDLVQGYRLLFEPNHDPVRQTEDGGIDLSQVTRVIITWIGDYHG